MKKKFLSLALSCALLLALAGCGTNNETSSGQSDSSPQVQTVTDMTYSITERYYTETGEVETLEVEGLYTGQVVDEIPNGEGTFVSESSDGDIWTYTGQFENGLYNGQGKMTLSAESDDQDENLDFEVGTFIDGLFTPTTYELFNTISSFATADYSISDENRDFMELNSDLLPAVTAEAQSKLSNFVDSSITYPMMTKTLDGLGGKFYHCPNAYVIQIFQTKMHGHDVTEIICSDADRNVYYILYDGVLPDVYDESTIEFTAMPVSASGYENVSGGFTNTIVMIGGSVGLV